MFESWAAMSKLRQVRSVYIASVQSAVRMSTWPSLVVWLE